MIAVLVMLVVELVSGNIICPDGTECQDKNTCCPTKTGYACCQYPSEKEKRAPAHLGKSDYSPVSVVYCDSASLCPHGKTCCKSPHGQWSCCPYTVGQCCFDGIHCCPFGYHCDSTSTRCFRGALSLPATPQIATMPSSIIQDQCCQSETGCCAIGFHCDEESKTCERDFEYLSPPKSMLSLQNQAGVIHCSDQFYCPAGNSCCKTLTGQLACCPYPLGQCCKDGKHCCQYGYDCDSTFTKCNKGYSSVPALLTEEAQHR